jgi:hypothetical protein
MILAPAACDSTSTSRAVSNPNAKTGLRIVFGFYALWWLSAGLDQCSGMTPSRPF